LMLLLVDPPETVHDGPAVRAHPNDQSSQPQIVKIRGGTTPRGAHKRQTPQTAAGGLAMWTGVPNAGCPSTLQESQRRDRGCQPPGDRCLQNNGETRAPPRTAGFPARSGRGCAPWGACAAVDDRAHSRSGLKSGSVAAAAFVAAEARPRTSMEGNCTA
jgi:hypothetical protein